MNNWTPDRPTKPGKYWLSLAKHIRAELDARVGYETQRCFVAIVFPQHIESLHINGVLDSVRVQDWLDGALWRPYVEPPDPFAEPSPFAESAEEQQRKAWEKWNSGAMDGGLAVTKPSEFKAYRLSDDAKTPNLRLILDVEPGMVTLYEADMTSRSPEAQETDLRDKIMMSQADARWLRDTLNNADLLDPPGWDR